MVLDCGFGSAYLPPSRGPGGGAQSQAARNRGEGLSGNDPGGIKAGIEDAADSGNEAGAAGEEDAVDALGGAAGGGEQAIDRGFDGEELGPDPGLKLLAGDGGAEVKAVLVEAELGGRILRQGELASAARPDGAGSRGLRRPA